jgi:hypothetical protein
VPNNEEKISSVAQFVERITEINNINPEIDYLYNRIPMYYRGQANYEWNLTPGLYRDRNLGQLEEIKREFENQYPDELYKNNGRELDEFEKLTKMQHYGFPTNLLDFTENPLVALFFACANNQFKKADASVFICNSFLFNFCGKFIVDNSSYQKTSTQFISYTHTMNYKEIKEKSVSYRNELGNMGINPHPPRFINAGKYLNRAASQNSVFLIFFRTQFKTIEKSEEFYFTDYEMPRTHSKYGAELRNNSTVLKIDKHSKERILKELDLLKINKRELFPEMDYASSYMRGNLWL